MPSCVQSSRTSSGFLNNLRSPNWGNMKIVPPNMVTLAPTLYALYSVQCTVYSVSVQWTVYNVQCAVYSVQCTVCNWEHTGEFTRRFKTRLISKGNANGTLTSNRGLSCLGLVQQENIWNKKQIMSFWNSPRSRIRPCWAASYTLLCFPGKG